MANTTNTCVINITFTKATSRSNIVSGDNLSNACGKIAKYIETSAGEIVAGKSYVIDGSAYIAGDGAEVFNDYTNNKAVGNYSHAEGYYTTARLTASHAEGWKTEAGNAAHAEGHLTIASGSGAHAEGSNTIAIGDRSHAEGYYTTAKKQSQHVEGEYNVLDTDSTSTRGKFAHIIGNGIANNARSNAYAIGWDGKIYQPSDPNADPNGVYLSSKVNTSALAPVATSGSFSDLSNKPSASSQGGSGKYIQSISQSNGTITATPATLSTTLSSTDSVAPTTNAVYQPVSENINNGVKNISQWSGGTAASANQTIALKIPITTDGDTYVISYATSLTTGYITVGIKDANDGLVVSAIQINNFGTKTATVTIPSNAAYFNVVSSVAGAYSDFMICKKKLWSVSETFQPYAPTNRTLFETLTAISEQEYQALTVKDKPIYFIYD